MGHPTPTIECRYRTQRGPISDKRIPNTHLKIPLKPNTTKKKLSISASWPDCLFSTFALLGFFSFLIIGLFLSAQEEFRNKPTNTAKIEYKRLVPLICFVFPLGYQQPTKQSIYLFDTTFLSLRSIPSPSHHQK